MGGQWSCFFSTTWLPRWGRIAVCSRHCLWQRQRKNTVAVINTTQYEGVNQYFCGFRGEWSSYGSQLSQLVEAASRNFVDMQVHSQFIVKFHTEILGWSRRYDTVLSECSLIIMVLMSIIASCCLDPSHKNWATKLVVFWGCSVIDNSILTAFSKDWHHIWNGNQMNTALIEIYLKSTTAAILEILS